MTAGASSTRPGPPSICRAARRNAYLAPWHIERGKLFVRQRCALTPGLDVERICRGIELTPLPGAGGQRPRRDGHRSRPDSRRRSHRPARRSCPRAKIRCLVSRVRRDREDGTLGLREPGRPRRAVPPNSSGTRSSPISAQRWRISSEPSRAARGRPSSTRTSSSRSIAATAAGRSAVPDEQAGPLQRGSRTIRPGTAS